MSAPASDWLRGQQAAITGRLASMSRAEAAALVRAHGGLVVGPVTRETAFLIVGEPLGKDGRLSARLQKARRLQQLGHPLCILAEEEFLARVGLESHAQVHRLYTTAQMCQILRIGSQRLRGWLRVGLVQPVETVHGVHYFDYQQVSWAKTLCALARAGVRPEQMRRSLEQLRRWLPVEQPLAQLVLLEQNGQLLVRLENGQLAEPTGQQHFDFGDDRTLPVLETTTGQRSADDWFAQGVELESAERWPEAADAYRQSLQAGGPSAATCFNLANVLHALGQPEQAVERYRQAVAIDPSFIECWNNLGTVLAEQGQRDAAVAAYRKVLQLAPDYRDVHYNLADVLDEMGRPAEARPHWRRYVQLDPGSPWAAYAQRRLRGVR